MSMNLIRRIISKPKESLESVIEKVLRRLQQEKEEEKVYCYVFVRKDIPIWAQIVQVGHACLGAGEFFHDKFAQENSTLIVLSVENQNELDFAQRVAAEQGIRSFLFYEQNQESLGENNVPSFTALCTEPLWGEG